MLESEDVISTNALKTLGLKINKTNNVWGFGNGIGNLSGSNHHLDLGNSGTGSDYGANSRLWRWSYYYRRCFFIKKTNEKLIKPLLKTGAIFKDSNNDHLPVTIKGIKSHYLLNTIALLLLLKSNRVFC